ncbi:ATP-binding protein [Microbacterium sediminicola]|uniref:ATP-binding protein n=1 Tax=Microbacterium sediminicola TaxID=415210 RepID=A0ABN2HJN3_9MICO
MTTAANARTSSLSTAWGQIPLGSDPTAGLGSFTRRRIERMTSILLAVGSAALGIQAFILAVAASAETGPWFLVAVVADFGALAALLTTYIVGRSIQPAAITFGAIYVVTLIVWPLLPRMEVPGQESTQPWTWYLVTVATVASIKVFSVVWQLVWTAFVPVLFGVTWLVQVRFAPEFWWQTLLDVSFAIILGTVFVTLAWMFRSIADNVDRARQAAVVSYTRVAATDAAENERVSVAALMHDSVLAALIAAERARSPREQALAVAMAQEALTRLANAEGDAGLGSEAPRTFEEIVEDVESGARGLGIDLVVQRTFGDDALRIPGRVATALTLATMQAIANSVEHAAGIGLVVTARQEAVSSRIHLEVRDRGDGFDMDSVPDDRLGIRGSIIARVAAVGGTVHITSDASGTLVRLTWQESFA